MDWICYIFSRGKHKYLVPGGSIDEAWNSLSKRQSMSLENCKKEYKYLGFMNENSDIWKV